MLDAGSGDDKIQANDGQVDVVKGGPGFDGAVVDTIDHVSGVESM